MRIKLIKIIRVGLSILINQGVLSKLKFEFIIVDRYIIVLRTGLQRKNK